MDRSETHDLYHEYNPAREFPLAHSAQDAAGAEGGTKNILKTLKYAVAVIGTAAVVVLASGTRIGCTLRAADATEASVQVDVITADSDSDNYYYTLSETGGGVIVGGQDIASGRSLLVFSALSPQTEYRLSFYSHSQSGGDAVAGFYFTTAAAGSGTDLPAGGAEPAGGDGGDIKTVDDGGDDEKPEEVLTGPEARLTLNTNALPLSGRAVVTANDAEILGGTLYLDNAYFSTVTAEQLIAGYSFRVSDTTYGLRTFRLAVNYRLGTVEDTLTVIKVGGIEAPQAAAAVMPSVSSFTHSSDGFFAVVALNDISASSFTANNAAAVADGIVDLTMTLDGTAAAATAGGSDGSATLYYSPGAELSVGTHNAVLTVTYSYGGAVQTLTSQLTVETVAFEIESFSAVYGGGSDTTFTFGYAINGVTFVSGNIEVGGGAIYNITLTAADFAAGSATLAAAVAPGEPAAIYLTMSDGNTYQSSCTVTSP